MSFNSNLNEAIGTVPGNMTRPGLQATRSGKPEILADTFDPAEFRGRFMLTAAGVKLREAKSNTAPRIGRGSHFR